MALEKEVSSIKKLCGVIANNTANSEKKINAAVKGITDSTEKASTKTADTLSETSKGVQAIAKNDSKLIENTDGFLNLAKTLITRMANAGNKLAEINKKLQENSFVSGGKIDPEFLEELKKLSDDDVKNMGIEPSILKKAIEAEDERQEAEKKKIEKEEKTIDKFGRAIEGFKRGIRDAKEETTSGSLGGWGFLGAISGAVGGWNAPLKEKQIPTQEERNNTTDDTILNLQRDIEATGSDVEVDDETIRGITQAEGGESLEQRAENLAEERGYLYNEENNSYTNFTGDGKPTYITKDELIEEVKAEAEKKYVERGNVLPQNKKRKSPLARLRDFNRKKYAKSEEGKIETVALDRNYIWDEESNAYLDNDGNYITKDELGKEVQAIAKNKRQVPKPIGVIDEKNKISTFDRRTGNTLSNNAMNLERGKEKSVTIISDNSAKVSNQNTTAFPTPISVRNSDGATKYFNDTI